MKLRDQRGQASIMIGMMIMTFILFFAFVVNTGMLVNAKINLQNAADLAAYSGAASQARVLNQISYLNYEMRRQYKKYIFRYYVMGNMAQKGFPRQGGGGPLWSPDGGTVQYGVPVVCMIFNQNDNFCQLAQLPKISIPQGGGPDSINDTLIEQLKKIEDIRQKNCNNISLINIMALRLWLFNTDPTLASLAQSGDSAAAVSTIAGLAQGLGIVPREILLHSRIKTLESYINTPPRTGVKIGGVGALQNGADPAADERTINAFLSAYYTLGNHTFAAGDIVMDELMANRLLTLKDINVKLLAYAVTFDVPPGAPPEGANCEPHLERDELQAPIPVGVYKDRSLMTYYAIRMRAKAKVMFSPFGDMELKAYAAAQPFGSRIGPVLAKEDFGYPGLGNLGNLVKGGLGANDSQIPNLPFRRGESAAQGQGWDNLGVMGAMYGQFTAGGAGALSVINGPAINRALQASMLPNPIEANLYNIPSDDARDDFLRHSDAGGGISFWAPIVSPAKPIGNIQDLVKDLMNPSSNTATATAALGDVTQKLADGMAKYITALRTGGGEGGEGFNYVRMSPPFHGADGKVGSIGTLTINDPKEARTSWSEPLNREYRDQGRTGYSVKLVSYDTLYKNRQKTDGATTWNNTLQLDADADEDVPALKH